MKSAIPGGKRNEPCKTGIAALSRIPYEYPALLLALALVMLNLMQFIQNQKWLVLICCILSVLLAGFPLFSRKVQTESRVFFILYAGYLLWLSLGVIWAVSGKFFLREFSKHLVALPLVLFIFFILPRRESAVRKLLFVFSALGALYAFFSIDNASIGLFHRLLYRIPGFTGVESGYESGTRLIGIFGNANISAGLLAISIFLSLYLLESAETRRQRVFAAIFAAMQADTFVLNFSLGATGFFLISVIVYLCFAGNRRSSVFLRMLEIAVPALLAAFLSFRFFEVNDGRAAIPVIAAVLCAAAAVLLELTIYPRLESTFYQRRRLAGGLLIAVLLLICAYGIAGGLIGGTAVLTKGQTLRRSCYLSAGDYELLVSNDGELNVQVISQDEEEVIMHTRTILYNGSAAEAAFTVPEDSRVVYLTFSTPSQATVREAVLDGAKSVSLHLAYPLLPGFVANRLQGLFANENAIQRTAFFRDGMKVFRDHPIIGAGLGSFETLLFGYQDFYYQTKYVHNHYIQVLLDSGIIGIILYLSVLVSVGAALWRGRRKDGDFRALHPALCAAFVMIVLHSCMEVVMSISLYLPYACAVFSLIAVCYGRPVSRRAHCRIAAAVPGMIALVYAVLIVINLTADAGVRKSTRSAIRFFDSLEFAANVDIFERNDWMVTYIDTCADTGLTSYKPQADRYAEQLIDVPSNSLHQHLITYYLTFREYDHALLAARRSVTFNYSSGRNWNACFACFADALLKTPEDEAEIKRCVRVLNDDLQSYLPKLMKPIRLNNDSKKLIADATSDE